jgi:hypothetical protein
MRKDRFQKLLSSTLSTLQHLTATKGEEYSSNRATDESDQHANFKRLGAKLDMDPKKVLAVYLTKHLDSIDSFLKNGIELSEPIDGRIDDAILYLILLKGLVHDDRAAKVQSPT